MKHVCFESKKNTACVEIESKERINERGKQHQCDDDAKLQNVCGDV